MTRAQRYGLASVLGGFAVAGYALYRDAEVVAGIVAVLDLAGLATVFLSSHYGGSNPDHETRTASGDESG